MTTETTETKSRTKPAENTGVRVPNSFCHIADLGARNLHQIAAKIIDKQVGISFDEYRALSAVGNMGPISPTTISRATSTDKVRISRALASLYKTGLARETTDKNDGRVRRVTLTPKGTQAFYKATKVVEDIDRAVLSIIGERSFVLIGAGMAQMMLLGQEAVEAASSRE